MKLMRHGSMAFDPSLVVGTYLEDRPGMTDIETGVTEQQTHLVVVLDSGAKLSDWLAYQPWTFDFEGWVARINVARSNDGSP